MKMILALSIFLVSHSSFAKESGEITIEHVINAQKVLKQTIYSNNAEGSITTVTQNKILLFLLQLTGTTYTAAETHPGAIIKFYEFSGYCPQTNPNHRRARYFVSTNELFDLKKLKNLTELPAQDTLEILNTKNKLKTWFLKTSEELSSQHSFHCGDHQ